MTRPTMTRPTMTRPTIKSTRPRPARADRCKPRRRRGARAFRTAVIVAVCLGMAELVAVVAGGALVPGWASAAGPLAAASGGQGTAAGTDAALQTVEFRYVGHGTQTVVVPAGVVLAQVRAIGGMGGSAPAREDVTGGDGAEATGDIAVTAGEVLHVDVGGFGGDSDGGSHPGGGGWGATGTGGRGGSSSSEDGGGGGGATGVEISDCQACAVSPVLVAGGGGGGGGEGVDNWVGKGGPGGSSGETVDPGHDGSGPGAGRGGGGAANGVPAGGVGGNGSDLGGGGGGGGAGVAGGSGGDGGGAGGGGGGGGGAGSSQTTSLLRYGRVVRGRTDDGNGLVVVTWSSADVFRYTGSPQTATVPAGAHFAAVRVIGGHGGTTSLGNGYELAAGDGAEVTGLLPVTPGQSITVKVAGRGGEGNGVSHPGDGGWGASGDGGRGGSGSDGGYDGGGGGGSSALQIAGESVVIAGGGGGTGGTGFSHVFDEGGPGGSSGGTVDGGHNGEGPGAGKGGAGGDAPGGSGDGGGNGSWTAGGGGGGGAGLNGGRGGGGGSFGGGGGGGGGAGSSLLSPSLEFARVVRGTTLDGNGQVSITWLPDAGICPDQQVNVGHDSPGTFHRLFCQDVFKASDFHVLERPEHGRLEHFDGGQGTFTYVPNRGFAGVDSMRVAAKVEDRDTSPFTVTFVVARTCFDQTVYVPLASSGVRVRLGCSRANDPGVFRFFTLPAHGHPDDREMAKGTFTYVPQPHYSGADTLTFGSANRGFASQPATVTFLVGSSGGPVCPDQHLNYVQSGGVYVQLRCPALGEHPSYRPITVPEHGRLEHVDLTAGTFTYVPDAGYLGQDSIGFQALGDGQISAPATVILTVTLPQAPMHLSASKTRIAPGESTTLTVQMPQDATGYVGFYDHEHDHGGLGTATLVDGVATKELRADQLGVGSHLLHASYGGNERWAANDSNRVEVTVAASAPRTPHARAVRSTETFNYTGHPETTVVPAGMNVAIVRVLGAHGGAAEYSSDGDRSSGGDGAAVTGRFAVAAGQLLTVKVGGHGGDGDSLAPGAGGWGATGPGGRGGGSGVYDGGGGGGASGLELEGENVILTGGGGGAGGGGRITSEPPYWHPGGAGGSSGKTVDDGHPGQGPGAGEGGAGGERQDGSGGTGGSSNTLGGAGGGGGGGWRGGAGGGGTSGGSRGGGGGGGAGSSLRTPRVGLSTIERGTTSDGNGQVTITWEHTDERVECHDEQVNVEHDSPSAPYRLRCSEDLPPASFRVLSLPAHGRLQELNLASGEFRYVPDARFSGVDSASFVGIAPDQETAAFTVTFVVAQQCFEQTVHVPLDSAGVAVQLGCSRTNQPGQFRLISLPKHGFVDHRDMTRGTFTYVPLPDYSGTDTLTFGSVIRDLASRPATVTFIVGPRTSPVCPDQHFNYVPSGGVHVQLHCPELGQHPSYRLLAVPEHGRLEDLDFAAGSFKYVPDTGYLGPDSVSYQAFNGEQTSARATVTFTIANPQAPIHLVASPTQIAPGESTTLTVQMPASATGYVGFYDHEHDHGGLGTAPIIDGVATKEIPADQLVGLW